MPVYATQAARNSSVNNPYIGQMTYIQATNKIEFWTGSAWVIANQDVVIPHIPTIYANEAARDAANPTPTAGDMVYLQNKATVQVYSGTSWGQVAGGSDINPLAVAGI